MHPAAWSLGISLVVLASSAVARGLEPAAPPYASQAADTLVGTVRGVYPDSGYIGVITGTGLAIRLERIGVYEPVVVEVDGVPSPLGALERGRVVRVVYRETVEGKVAQSIATLRVGAEGGA
jgi:hypothetical protein